MTDLPLIAEGLDDIMLLDPLAKDYYALQDAELIVLERWYSEAEAYHQRLQSVMLQVARRIACLREAERQAA